MSKKRSILLMFFITAISLVASYSTIFADDPNEGEDGGETTMNKHSQVVGSGSKRLEDWRAGCCLGEGDCINTCHLPENEQFCD